MKGNAERGGFIHGEAEYNGNEFHLLMNVNMKSELLWKQSLFLFYFDNKTKFSCIVQLGIR